MTEKEHIEKMRRDLDAIRAEADKIGRTLKEISRDLEILRKQRQEQISAFP